MSSILQLSVFVLGIGLIAGTLYSAVETFVLPRSAPDLLTRFVFRSIRFIFNLPMRRAHTFEQRDRIMAFYAPVSLLALVPSWYILICLGYTCLYWALGVGSWYQAFVLSGSSLLTLGFSVPQSPVETVLAFSEATLGLIMVALLIAYLPTMYSAFSRRETAVTLLEVRAGNPPSAVEMLLRFNRIHSLEMLREQWQAWENWFAEIEESHTSLAALVFFRSPQYDHSWVTAAGAVLDAAALTLSATDIPPEPQAALCIRAGYLALRRIADFFGVPYNRQPKFPQDTISISRQDFEQVCDLLGSQGVPVKADKEQAWQDFAGWRVNYDTVLLALANLTMAPEAPWLPDRAGKEKPPSNLERSK